MMLSLEVQLMIIGVHENLFANIYFVKQCINVLVSGQLVLTNEIFIFEIFFFVFFFFCFKFLNGINLLKIRSCLLL